MRHLAFLPVTLSIVFPSSAVAASKCTVFAEQAQGLNGSPISLKVGPGNGLNLNLIPLEETIKKVWLDDLSQIGLSFDGNLCQWSSSQGQDCINEGATVIHLRQTELINIPNLPRSPSGTTLLTAITEGNSGRKLYQFKVVPVSNEPSCTTITIRPDEKKPAPNLPLTAVRETFPSPVLDRTSTITRSAQWQPQANVPNRQPNEALAKIQPSITSPTVTTSEREAIAAVPQHSLASVNTHPVASTQQRRASSRLDSSRSPEHLPTDVSSLSLRARSRQTLVAAPRGSTGTVEYSQQVGSKPGKNRTLNTPQSRASTSSSSNEGPVFTRLNEAAIDDANAAVYGLVVAKQKGQINLNTTQWRKAQGAIRQLRLGKSKEEAARLAKIPLPVLVQLIAWGQQRP